MREILFRGKRIEDGEWEEGFYTEYNPFRSKGKSVIETKWGEYVVDPYTIGQYTGLTDKNGKKIFEGDICRNTKTAEIVSVAWHGTFAGYVWSKRKENSKCLYEFGELFRMHDKYEIIGTVHDNPELLEDKA